MIEPGKFAAAELQAWKNHAEAIRPTMIQLIKDRIEWERKMEKFKRKSGDSIIIPIPK